MTGPNLAEERRGSNGPECKKSKASRLEPKQDMLREDELASKSAESRVGRESPGHPMPVADDMNPSRARLRSEGGKPGSKESGTEGAKPNCPLDLEDKGKPRKACSSTTKDAPQHASPKAEEQDPNQATLRDNVKDPELERLWAGSDGPR